MEPVYSWEGFASMGLEPGETLDHDQQANVLPNQLLGFLNQWKEK